MTAAVEEYTGLNDADSVRRRERYRSLVNQYYNLVTDFYEFGWGPCWHFAPRKRGESFKASLLRHEHYLADRLALGPGMHVFDVGCGVGGPMGVLARYSGASFTGININAYQIERARHHTRDVQSQCRFIHGDYMRIPAAEASFDAAFSIEATPHAPDKAALFKEIWRVLRPGSSFAIYEWCLTEQYDPGNPVHRRIRKDIVIGTGLPDLPLPSEVLEAFREAGFEILDSRDLAVTSDPGMPWYRSLQGRDFTLGSIPRTPAGRALTNLAVWIGERLRLAPRGTSEVSSLPESRRRRPR